MSSVSRAHIHTHHTHHAQKHMSAYFSPSAPHHTLLKCRICVGRRGGCVSYYAQVAAGTAAVATPESGSVHVTVVGVDVAVL